MMLRIKRKTLVNTLLWLIPKQRLLHPYSYNPEKLKFEQNTVTLSDNSFLSTLYTVTYRELKTCRQNIIITNSLVKWKSIIYSFLYDTCLQLMAEITWFTTHSAHFAMKTFHHLVSFIRWPLIQFSHIEQWASYQIRKIAGWECAGNAGTCSPPPGVSVKHLPWCMQGSLTSGFFWSGWRGKRSRHSRHMRNPKFYLLGKRQMRWGSLWQPVCI